MLQQITASLQHIEGKLDSLTTRLDTMNACINKHNTRLHELEARTSTAQDDIVTQDTRVKRMETEQLRSCHSDCLKMRVTSTKWHGFQDSPTSQQQLIKMANRQWLKGADQKPTLCMYVC